MDENQKDITAIDWNGRYAYVHGLRGQALIRVIDAEVFKKSEDSRPFLFIDSAEIVAGKHEFPAAFNANEVLSSPSIDEPRSKFIEDMKRTRERLFSEIGTIDVQIAQAELYHANV